MTETPAEPRTQGRGGFASGGDALALPQTDWLRHDLVVTGPPEDVAARVAKGARIFASPGEQFGPGGATWLRFNFATPRPILTEALTVRY